jgi:hypothetical protein
MNMNCPNCHQPVEADAAFCGNCGQPIGTALQRSAGHLAAAGAAELPGYAQATPEQHTGELKALLSVLGGVTGLVGALFVPLLGLVLGAFGVFMGTLSRSSTRRGLSTAGLMIASLAILGGLGSLTYTINQNHKKTAQAAIASQNNPGTTVSANLSTPCYDVNFVDELNVNNTSNSCNMSAYNSSTLATSTNAYKVFASKANITSSGAFTSLAKAALEKDVSQNLPGFTIDSERVSGFAGSPAYTINLSDKVHNVAVVETAAYHQVTDGNNVFVIVHAINGSSADLQILEAQWQWK